MKLCIRINLKSEKGNAMLMALSVILILTSFGTVSLMTSMANIQMSAKYKNWSKDYYALDVDAEAQVNQLNSLLENAESNAQNYMAEQFYLSPTDPPSGDFPYLAQTYINRQWNTLVEPYLTDMESQAYKDNQPIFMKDILNRLYYYYASKLLADRGYALVTTVNDSAIPVSEYQNALFDDSEPQILADGNLSVNLNSNTVNNKTVAVKLKVIFPTYTTVQQTKNIVFKGNPIWTNAITAAGSIGFENGTSTIQGDLFSADKEESLYLDDNIVSNTGIYSDGATVDIHGNVYSKGNLHIIRSDSKITVSAYPPDFQTTLKNTVFSENGLFFDDSESDAYPQDNYPYIQKQEDLENDIPLYFVNQDIMGGNIYCNSLVVDHTVDNQRVDRGIIEANGNVSTFNDIKMNNSIDTNSDGSDSAISVLKNFIGINSSAHNGDPNANSTVINNTALAGNKITLNGKMIVPGTAWAEYAGVWKNEWSRFFWPSSTNPERPEWVSQQYYQTGESITAKNADIYSAYMSPVNNPDPLYNYSYEPFTLDTDPENPPDGVLPEAYIEENINSFYLMRGDNKDSTRDQDSLIPKKSQLTDYVNIRRSSLNPVVSNVYVGSTIEGYSLAEALLHSSGALTADVYGDSIANLPDDPEHQPKPIIDMSGPSGYFDYYTKFQGFLSKIFLSKVQNLGTLKRLPISFENFVNKSDGYIAGSMVENYVNKSAVLDVTKNLFVGINSDPIGKHDSFTYIQQLTDGGTTSLNLGDSSGIIYCEGNLDITGGTFRGAIICEGTVTVEGASITYDKEVIQKVLEKDEDEDDVAYSFFSKLLCFESPVTDKTKGFVDKSAVLDINGSLRSEISSDPSGSAMQNSFVYIQQPADITYTLTSGNYSGILYCEGNLDISGDVSFEGAVICEGKVTVSGNNRITYNEEIIQSVLVEDGKARSFFTPGAMGKETKKSYSTTAYDGAVRQTNVKRYQIIEWKEGQN